MVQPIPLWGGSILDITLPWWLLGVSHLRQFAKSRSAPSHIFLNSTFCHIDINQKSVVRSRLSMAEWQILKTLNRMFLIAQSLYFCSQQAYNVETTQPLLYRIIKHWYSCNNSVWKLSAHYFTKILIIINCILFCYNLSIYRSSGENFTFISAIYVVAVIWRSSSNLS